MTKILSALKSRTIMTLIVLVLVNGVPAIQDQIPAEWQPLVTSVLAILAGYFRVNARVVI